MTIGKATRTGLWVGKRSVQRQREGETSPIKAIAPPTEREGQLVVLIAQGLPNKIIALELGISPNTVRAHVSNIIRKYKLRNRTQVAMILMPMLTMNPATAVSHDR